MSRMIFRPVITEKTLRKAAEENVYTFAVDPAMTKPGIAQKISELYKVDVEWVRTIIRQATAHKTGRRRLPGMTARVKKAYVRLKEGQTITLFDFGSQEAQTETTK